MVKGIRRRIVPVEIRPQQNKAFHLVWMVRRKLGRHSPAHGMAGQIPMLDIRELLHDPLGGIGGENSHAKGHVHQDAGHAQLTDLIQQRQVSRSFHLGPWVKNKSSIAGRLGG